MHLYFVRHGIMGTTSSNDFLTELGEQQARELGHHFAHLPITHIISSPLVRALGTTQLLTATMGTLPSFEVWPLLREGLYSDLIGHGTKELKAHYPLAIFPDTMGEETCLYPADTQESLIQRSQQVVQDLKQSFHDEEHIILVAHGGIITYLFHELLHIPIEAFTWYQLTYASISHIELIPPTRRASYPPLYPTNAIEIISIGETGHLSAKA